MTRTKIAICRLLLVLASVAFGWPAYGHDCGSFTAHTPFSTTFTNGSGNNLWLHDERIDDLADPNDVPIAANWTSRAFPSLEHVIYNPNEPVDHRHPIPGCYPTYHAFIENGFSPLIHNGGARVESVTVAAGGGLSLLTTNNNFTASLLLQGAGLTNNGAIKVNDFAGDVAATTSAHIYFDFGNGVYQIDGSGSIELRGGSNSQGAAVNLATSIGGGPTWTVTHGANHTIFGSGHVIARHPFQHANGGTFINNGTLLGNVPNGGSLSLVLNHNTNNQNNGNVRAANGGSVYFEGNLVQGGSGEFLADAGTIQLGGASLARIAGGTLRTQNAGRLIVGWTAWSNLVHTGTTEMQGTNTFAPVIIPFGGGFINNGTIRLNTTDPTKWSRIAFAEGDATIGGTGTLILNGEPDGNAEWTISGGATTTNGPNHTIRGRGLITTFGENGGKFINDGTINADHAPDNIHLALRGTPGSVNNGVIKATNGGVLSIGGRLDQSAQAQLLADGGTVGLGGARIIGGTITSANAGKVRVDDAAWGNLVHAGATETQGTNVVAPILKPVEGGFTNNGTILLNHTNPGFWSRIVFNEGDATIAGAGAVILNGVPAGNAEWVIAGGATTTNGAGHTIRGRGLITTFGEGGGKFVNNGTVNADTAPDNIHLALRGEAGSVNNGIIKASNGGVLSMGGRLDQAPGAQIFADGGNVFIGGTVAGGKLVSANGAFIEGASLALEGNITNNAALRLRESYEPVKIQTATLTNNGTITNPTTQNELWFTGGNTTINGSGAIVLRNGSAMNLMGNTITNGPNHTLKGDGVIHTNGGTFLNNGIVAPGESPGTLTFNGNFTQTENGTINIEIGGNTAGSSYDHVVVNGTATLNGALKITLVDGYRPALGDVFTILSPSAVNGSFAQINAPGMEVQANYAAGAITVTVTKLAPIINSATSASGDENQPFSYQITASDDPTNFGATGLPAGLTINPATGVISGTPTVAGTFSITISASNSAGTGTAQLTLTIVPDPTATPTPTASPSPTATPGPTAAPTTTLLNISTRLRVGTGENALIGGFIITGTEPKRVIIRAIGPSLAQQDVAGVLQDPTLQLFDGAGEPIASNDNWKDDQQSEVEETTIPPSDDLESAIVRTLAPGNYTAAVRGKNDTTGIGLVEIYDVASGVNAKLANISSRGFVETGENVLIGGFIVSGGGPETRVVLRAIGPSLGASGVEGALRDPVLELIDANGMVVRENDDWKQSQQSDLEALQIAPANDLESALIANVSGGNYTAIVRGNGETAGVGLVEVYNVQ